MKLACCVLVWACALLTRAAEAFVPPLAGRAGVALAGAREALTSPVAASSSRQTAFSRSLGSPAEAFSASRLSSRSATTTTTTTMGLFGLGAPEIAVCIAVAALVLGPDKMAGFAKDMGKMAGELKDVPKEFQAGIEEGEKKTMNTVKEIESKGLTLDAEPAENKKKEEEKA